MKTIAILIAASFMCLPFCGCKQEPSKISGTEFTAMLKRNPETMRSTQYIGIQDGMAILKVSTMSSVNQKKWSDTFFMTPVNDLPRDFPYPLPVPAPLDVKEE